MFPLFESIQVWQGQPLHLEWHQQRITRAAHYFWNIPAPFQLESIIEIPQAFSQDKVKCRIAYGREQYEIIFSRYHPKPLNSLRLVYDDEVEYTHKFNNREALNTLYQQKGGCDDILIVKQGLLTDSSYCNLVFWEGEKWWTPAESLLPGTCRARHLAQGRIYERSIHVEDLPHYQGFKLINAMLDLDTQPLLPITHIY